VWAWTAPVAPGDAKPWAFRLAGSPVLLGVVAAPGDRRLRLDFEEHRIHLELWPPGNVLVEETSGRLVWCARTRPASNYRGAIAAGELYGTPQAPTAVDPLARTEAELAALLDAMPEEPGERLTRIARDLAGMPKGMLETFAPTLPKELTAPALRAWFAETYADGPTVRAYAWRWPSAGATLVTRALTLAPGETGVTFVGSYGSWAEAAREVSKALPEPIDAGRIAAAKAALKRIERAEAKVRAEIADAARAGEVRGEANALAAFLSRVPKGADSVSLPDPADPARTLVITLDPKLKPHENVDRIFKRAGKLERVAEQAPARLAELALELEQARRNLESAERGDPPPPSRANSRGARAAAASQVAPPIDDGEKKRDRTPSALVPRRYKTAEGWDVLVGKNNQGNDHLTHRLARPEDYWMHVHGAAGSHVVLRRGKGPNEPSKATIEEVAGWAAFFSQARNAGTVPVTVTQKKYVSKPRKSPAGLAHVLRAKTVFARPTEPSDSSRVENGEG
jgi:predicted ribosome quality control (RQC) complex YloA/Tae2 family protein